MERIGLAKSIILFQIKAKPLSYGGINSSRGFCSSKTYKKISNMNKEYE